MIEKGGGGWRERKGRRRKRREIHMYPKGNFFTVERGRKESKAGREVGRDVVCTGK